MTFGAALLRAVSFSAFFIVFINSSADLILEKDNDLNTVKTPLYQSRIRTGLVVNVTDGSSSDWVFSGWIQNFGFFYIVNIVAAMVAYLSGIVSFLFSVVLTCNGCFQIYFCFPPRVANGTAKPAQSTTTKNDSR